MNRESANTRDRVLPIEHALGCYPSFKCELISMRRRPPRVLRRRPRRNPLEPTREMRQATHSPTMRARAVRLP